ncbi:hypothetical protein T492DRAFT_850166 [Pavlovales sp. CCMP2436]|nr:hypothetical protein T492DRAFT_850166 [Pavlovales sp. CCMP2436]
MLLVGGPAGGAVVAGAVAVAGARCGRPAAHRPLPWTVPTLAQRSVGSALAMRVDATAAAEGAVSAPGGLLADVAASDNGDAGSGVRPASLASSPAIGESEREAAAMEAEAEALVALDWRRLSTHVGAFARTPEIREQLLRG